MIKYLKNARKAQIEGTVVLYVCIDEFGQVVDTKVLKSFGNNGCYKVGIEAVKVKRKPI